MVDRLLERERELGVVRERVERARAGRGQILVIEGPAGIGKSRLLTEGRQLAGSAGMAAVTACGEELERHFSFGVVRQLFERRLVAAPASERRALLAGAAGLAAPLFSYEAGMPQRHRHGANDPFAILHGLYWLCANLARRSPLLVTLDDAHWADGDSLRWLVYLARRVEELPILLTVALRRGDPDTGAEPLSMLPGRAGEVLQPAPLSVEAVAKLVRSALSYDADLAFCQACHAVTRGNPFLLHHLVAVLADDRVEPTAAQAKRVRALAPETVARAVVLRLARLPRPAAALARAVAIFEAGVELCDAAALAGQDEDVAREAADILANAEILAPERPLRFVHPMVQQAIRAELSVGERASAHKHAARLRHERGATAELLAGHLLLTDPSGDAWVAETLRQAGERALADGAPEAAAACLRRALREPPPPRALAGVLFALGQAEVRAGEPAGIEHLRDARKAATPAGERARITLVLARLLTLAGDGSAAIQLLEDATAALGDEDHELSVRLEAELNLAAWFASPPRIQIAARLRELGRTRARHGAGRLLLANAAYHSFTAGEPASRAAELAERALAGGRLLAEESAESLTFHLAVRVLTMTDRLEQAAAIYDEALTDARRRGSRMGFAITSCWRARNNLLCGAVAEAEADARDSLAITRELGWELGLPVAVAFLIDALIERGDLDGAVTALAESQLGAEVPDSFLVLPLLYTRGCLALLRGRTRAGLNDLQACGVRHQRYGIDAPGMAPWRVAAAQALVACGETKHAARLAEDELTVARRFGAPRSLGAALRTAALVAPGARGIRLLREAIAVLEPSQARLEHARALRDLGANLRRAGALTEAREVLRQSLDLASRCAALMLAQGARDELVAAGARPRRLTLGGIDALTAGERRVAELAAKGLTNREIAQALFVTQRTVETHLTHVYQKLNISSRTGLSRALDSPHVTSSRRRGTRNRTVASPARGNKGE